LPYRNVNKTIMADADGNESNVSSDAEVVEEQGETKIESPWPHLDSMFKCCELTEKLCKFVCLLCAPKHKTVAAYINSPSNLRKHVQVSIVNILSCYL
jgi:hypothetical protein